MKVSALILVAFLALLSANAAPHAAPTASQAQAVTRQVLTLVNEARAKRRRCGWKRFDAAAPLVLSDVLQQAALAPARDMAERKILSHGGRDGSTPGERATRFGYRWRVVGENIAAGQSTAEQAVAEWLGSQRHCANLMSADYSEMGIAYAVNPQSTLGIYWGSAVSSATSRALSTAISSQRPTLGFGTFTPFFQQIVDGLPEILRERHARRR